jgi:predicted ester cyclase
MSEENKALVRRVVDEAWNQGDLRVVDEIFAPDYREHNPSPGQEPGIDGYKAGVSMMRAAFPDLFLDVGEELMGTPASGQHVSSDEMVFARLERGQVTERWAVQDGPINSGCLRELSVPLSMQLRSAGRPHRSAPDLWLRSPEPVGRTPTADRLT